MSDWVWMVSSLNNVVKVHQTDKGKLAVYRRYGWEQVTPKAISLADLSPLMGGHDEQ